MAGRLERKVAVITGAGTGIGRATTCLFVAEGAQVFAAGRRDGVLTALAEELGDGVTPVVCDVTIGSDLDRLYETVADRAGRIDVVFANAGIGTPARLDEVTEEHFDATLALNTRAVLFTVQKALPLLAQDASIVLTGSTAAVQGTEAFGVYSASKAALRALTRTWANELKKQGIRVNLLTPGPTRTPPMLACPPEMIEMFASQVPLGRMADPSEIARAALFLAIQDSSFITGTELCVDGGTNQIHP